MNVLVVDDHSVFGEAFAAVLKQQTWVETVTFAASATQAHQAVSEKAPDVMVIDQRLGDTTGCELIRKLNESNPNTPAILLSSDLTDKVLLEAVEVGCAGVLSKTEKIETVLAAIRAATLGELAMSEELVARLMVLLRKRPLGPTDLSRRELDVLEQVAAGHQNLTIAENLFLSVHTVRNHVATILRKLGAHSKLQAVVVARDLGLIEQ